MKNLLFILVFCLILLPAAADEEVYLDLNPTDVHQFKIFEPDLKNERKESDEFDTDMILHPFQYLRKEFIDLKSDEAKNK